MKPVSRFTSATLLCFVLLVAGCGDSGSSAMSQSTNIPAQTSLKREEDIAERGMENTVAAGTLARLEAPSGDVTMERCLAQRRYLVFHTNEALDAVNDTNGVNDVYLRDLLTGTVTLVSKNSAGVAGNGASSYATISPDGKRIAYQSLASDLVSGDTNGKSDVFLYTRVGQATTRVSLTIANLEAADDSSFPALSSNGSFVTFVSKADLTGVGTGGIQNLYMRKVDGSTTKLFSRGSGTGANANVYFPVMSSDTRYIAYVSQASNLVAGDTNNANDIFLFDRSTGLTERVSLNSSGQQADGGSSMPSISDDGNVIAFESKATNLVPGDTNGARDVFVRNRSTGTTTRVSVDSSGGQGNGISYHSTLTRDGSRVAFASQASNLINGDTNNVSDVFQRLVTDPTTIARASRNIVGDLQGDGPSDLPSYDSDDNDLAFRSSSTNLDWANSVSNNEIFLANRASGTAYVVGRVLADTTARVNLNGSGEEAIANPPGTGMGFSNDSEITRGNNSVSADGRYVVFSSASPNLVPNDTNGDQDVFVRDRLLGTTIRVSVSSSGEQASGSLATISANGRFVAFTSAAANLVPGDTNLAPDVFVHDQQTHTTTRVSLNNSGEEGIAYSGAPSISGDGRYVVFVSDASNLVAETPAGYRGVYLYDRSSFTVTRCSAPYRNGSDCVISADGEHVAFTQAPKAYDSITESQIFEWNRIDGRTMISPAPANPGAIAVSPPPYFPGDPDAPTIPAAVYPPAPPPVSYPEEQTAYFGSQASISADGRYISYTLVQRQASGFGSFSPIYYHPGRASIEVYDRIARTTRTAFYRQTRKFSSLGSTAAPAISGNGTLVTLVSEDSSSRLNCFAVDLVSLSTCLIGRPYNGSSELLPNNSLTAPACSLDGRSTLFGSGSTNLVSSDTNSIADIFAKGWLPWGQPEPGPTRPYVYGW